MAQSSFDWGALAGGVLQTASNIWGQNPKSASPVVINTGSSGTSGGANTSFSLGGNNSVLLVGLVALLLIIRK